MQNSTIEPLEASARFHRENCKQFLESQFNHFSSVCPRFCAELRILNYVDKGRTRNGIGFFNNIEAILNVVDKYNGKATICVGVNPRPSKFLNDPNKIKFGGEGAKDKDIEHLAFFLIDLDTIRPKGTASSKEELDLARPAYESVLELLQKKGISPIVGMSGNGRHILAYLSGLKNSEESIEALRLILEYLQAEFGDEYVNIDVVTYNASRVVKLYGTVSIKGMNTEDRLWRTSKCRLPSEIRPIDLITCFQNEITLMRQRKSRQNRSRSTKIERIPHQQFSKGDYSTLDIVGLCNHLGLYLRPIADKKHAVTCPWSGQHSTNTSDTSTIVFEGGSGQWPVFHCSHAHCADRKISDLLAYAGSCSVDQFCSAEYRTKQEPQPPSNQSDEWQAILEVESQEVSIAAISPELIPSAIRPWLTDISYRMQVPLICAAVLAFTMFSALLGRKVRMFPKSKDDWYEPSNLWCMLIMPSGLMKSPLMRAILKPLDELTKRLKREFEEIESAAKANETVLTARIKAEKEKLSDVYKKDKPSDSRLADIDQITRTIRQLEQELKSAKVTPKRIVINDATTEKVAELCAENPNGLFLVRDELAGWLKTMEKPGREGDREFYLESSNGKGSYDVDRIKRGHIHIPALCLSILGGIQPSKIESYVESVVHGHNQDDGLLQRFNLMVHAELSKEFEFVDRAPNEVTQGEITELVRKMYEIEKLGFLVTDNMIDFRFSERAQAIFNQYYCDLEVRLRSGSEDCDAFRSHIGKYRKLVPVLALVFYVIEIVASQRREQFVDERSISLALAWAEILESHAKQVYAFALNPEINAAMSLIGKIKKGKIKDGMTVREAKRLKGRYLKNKESFDLGLSVLIEKNWVKLETIRQDRGAPSEILRLHPSLHSKGGLQ